MIITLHWTVLNQMDQERMKSKKSTTFRDMYRTMPIEGNYSLYKRILDEMCKVILEHVLERSEGFKMPYGLGFI